LSAGWYWQALSVATAIACGLLIGIERGFDLRDLKAHTRVAGVRTFTITGLVSGLAGLAARFGQPVAGGALVAGTVAVLAIGYANRPQLRRAPDATTPMAARPSRFTDTPATIEAIAPPIQRVKPRRCRKSQTLITSAPPTGSRRRSAGAR
jgi:hypothetical protein